MKIRGQLAVRHARSDGHGMRIRIQRNYLVHRFQGEEMACAVGYFVEAVACAKDLQVVLRFNKLADLFNRVGRVQTFGAVFEIARPVCKFRRRQPGEEWGDDGTSHHRREDFDEVSFVHSQGLERRNCVGETSGFGQDNGDHLTLVPFSRADESWAMEKYGSPSDAAARNGSRLSRRLRLPLPFHESDVLIEGEVGEAVHTPT